MAASDASSFLIRAQRSLEEGNFEEAKRAIERGYELSPEDERVREFYQQILIADGVRLARVARDLRRDEIRSLSKKQRSGYRDSEAVTQAFLTAVTSLDKVLEVDPHNAKALMLKAGVLDRMDRKGNREEVEDLFRRALEVHPGNEELIYARDRLLLPCRHCHDTGRCQDCQGSGEVSALFVRAVCPSCNGSGICNRCGLL